MAHFNNHIMKKILITCIAILISLSCFAQKTVVYMNNGYWQVSSALFAKVDSTGSYADLLNLPGSASPTTVSGSTSGSCAFSVAVNQTNWKKIVIHGNALTGTATFTFPTAFSFTPGIFGSSATSAVVVTSLSTTSVTITGTSLSGFIILEGF